MEDVAVGHQGLNKAYWLWGLDEINLSFLAFTKIIPAKFKKCSLTSLIRTAAFSQYGIWDGLSRSVEWGLCVLLESSSFIYKCWYVDMHYIEIAIINIQLQGKLLDEIYRKSINWPGFQRFLLNGCFGCFRSETNIYEILTSFFMCSETYEGHVPRSELDVT